MPDQRFLATLVTSSPNLKLGLEKTPGSTQDRGLGSERVLLIETLSMSGTDSVLLSAIRCLTVVAVEISSLSEFDRLLAEDRTSLLFHCLIKFGEGECCKNESFLISQRNRNW